ncbi:hypothetical protein IV493_04645 [Pantoea sp. SM3640]|uniref:LA2681 family HEPN domain-containing protein n=1 Tax=Pantoea sp. SM3640 TaxID=2787629 RepID=UPI0018A7549F|nr:LA2681 family HEPN domain-containing protein [Pantoea sp. SM3640]QPG28119.1 hypothetical protein IV493_04645 [Pantoea sp. SM3640]
MDENTFIAKINSVGGFIDSGDFDKASNICYELLNCLPEFDIKYEVKFSIISNIAGYLIDAGGFGQKVNVIKSGVEILKEHERDILAIISPSSYFYNLANGLNCISNINISNQINFDDVILLNEVKNCFWMSYKYALDEGSIPPELMVNLANALKKQYRISEAIDYYDTALSIDETIPQAWVNRSAALELLNDLSTTYSIKMLKEIRLGYVKAIETGKCIHTWVSTYNSKIECLDETLKEICQSNLIDEDDLMDENLSLEEYLKLSPYQKFCIDKNLMLSDHSLYCNCYAASRDNITIATTEEGVFGEFIIPMEMVLNRLKAEYSLSRRLFFEYSSGDVFVGDEEESCYSELFNGEVLYSNVEKLRTSFRMCFGILDKIAVALCELFDVKPRSGNIYFNNFWQLKDDKRREKFNKINNKGLMGLYSIAMDLNDTNGELSFFKSWRNDLEHNFLVIHEKGVIKDLYESYSFFKDIKFIEKESFEKHFQQLIKLVKSAIFLFVYTVRIEGKKNIPQNCVLISNEIGRKLL